ncbi:hypothetical protein [Streptomyces flaveolus]
MLPHTTDISACLIEDGEASGQPSQLRGEAERPRTQPWVLEEPQPATA